MEQIYFNVFCLYMLPVVSGLVLGILLRKKKTYIFAYIMLAIGVIWWRVMPHISTHGNEGPGLLLWMYSFFTAAFSLTELIKYMKKTISRKGENVK